MNVRRMLLLISFLVSLTSQPALVDAGDWAIGDVFAAVGGGMYKVYKTDGTSAGTVLRETLYDSFGGFTTGCAFDRGTSNLYTTNFTNTQVVKFAFGHPHAIRGTIDTAVENCDGELFSCSFSFQSESIVFDKFGNFYVGNANGNGRILKYDAAGNLLATFAADIEDRGTDWIDLTADQKTIFYTSEGRLIKRFDVSTNTQLADFTLTPLPGSGPAFALRLLPPGDGTGGLLVADTFDIKRLDASGNVLQTYDVSSGEIGEDSWFALALDPNGKSFWAGDSFTGNFYRFNIATGAIEVGPIATGAPENNGFFGLCVAGEPTVAADNDADGVVNAVDTCPNWANAGDGEDPAVQAACDICRLDFNPDQIPSFCPFVNAAESSSPGTFPQGGPVVITALLTPNFTITVPRPDCFNTTFTFFDANGDPLHGQHRHRTAYGIFPGSPDIITIPGNTSFPVQCDQSENYNFSPGTFPYVATFANNLQDSDIDPQTGLCTVPSCVNLSLVVVTSPQATVTIEAPPSGTPPVTKVSLDIKPGGFPNSWGCRSDQALPVAVLSTASFDATTINADTVRFGKNGTETGEVHMKAGHAVRHVTDVNGDGKPDMVFHFSFPLTGFKCADIPSGQQFITLNGILKGKTLASSPMGVTDIAGADSIRLVPGK